MGASQVQRRYAVVIKREWCKDCGICAAFCPSHVFEADERGETTVARAEDCTGCLLCELRCPDFAVAVTAEGPAADGGGERVGTEPVHAG